MVELSSDKISIKKAGSKVEPAFLCLKIFIVFLVAGFLIEIKYMPKTFLLCRKVFFIV